MNAAIAPPTRNLLHSANTAASMSPLCSRRAEPSVHIVGDSVDLGLQVAANGTRSPATSTTVPAPGVSATRTHTRRRRTYSDKQARQREGRADQHELLSGVAWRPGS